MQLFWYLILGLGLCITYLVSQKNQRPIYAGVFIACLLGISGLLYTSGIDVPGAGFDTSTPNQVTTLNYSYTTSNSVLVAGAALLFFAYGGYMFWLFLKKSISGGIHYDGSFK